MRSFRFLPVLTVIALVSAHPLAQGTSPSMKGDAKAAPKAAAKTAATKTAAGAPRVIEITAKDTPTANWDTKTITAKPGESLTIRLKAVGTMPKMAMSHNFVLLKAGTTEKQASDFAMAAMMAAPTYIPESQKSMVIASTTGMVGAGETTDITFKAPTAPGVYRYLCTFPGHAAAGMTGTLTVK